LVSTWWPAKVNPPHRVKKQEFFSCEEFFNLFSFLRAGGCYVTFRNKKIIFTVIRKGIRGRSSLALFYFLGMTWSLERFTLKGSYLLSRRQDPNCGFRGWNFSVPEVLQLVSHPK